MIIGFTRKAATKAGLAVVTAASLAIVPTGINNPLTTDEGSSVLNLSTQTTADESEYTSAAAKTRHTMGFSDFPGSQKEYTTHARWATKNGMRCLSWVELRMFDWNKNKKERYMRALGTKAEFRLYVGGKLVDGTGIVKLNQDKTTEVTWNSCEKSYKPKSGIQLWSALYTKNSDGEWSWKKASAAS